MEMINGKRLFKRSEIKILPTPKIGKMKLSGTVNQGFSEVTPQTMIKIKSTAGRTIERCLKSSDFKPNNCILIVRLGKSRKCKLYLIHQGKISPFHFRSINVIFASDEFPE
jgi:hypothetical protein